jgi:hypothetical protein
VKIWFSYGSEHSSNLVIIGTFTTAENAESALKLLREATEVANAEYEAGRLETIGRGDLSEEVLKFAKSNNFYTVSLKDLSELIYEYHPKRVGDSTLVITTEEYDVGSFVKIMTEYGAKVEVYSAHSYPSKYGRQTYQSR